MALNKPQLKLDVKQLFQQLQQVADNETALNQLSSGLADLIDAYVRSATVTVAAGIPVSTTGTAAAQTGATTSTGNATIS